MLNRLTIILIFMQLCMTSFGQKPTEKLSGNLVIFHAGSLAMPMKEIATAFKKLHPGVNILTESAGSVECARKITDLKKPCDIIASSDYTVIDKMLIPGHADWNLQFCSNELCIVFTDQSKYASAITTRNWFDVLMRKDVVFGRSDPNADPCGYRSVMAIQLAEKHHGKPGLAASMLLKDQKNIRPKEVDLLALLETRTVDYIFLYKSVAIQHKLRYIELPEEINLKNPALESLYHTATVEINGKEPGQKTVVSGEPMVYGITMLRTAPNREVAVAFIEFMLSEGKGMKILNDLGQPSVIPQKNQNFNKLPGSLKKFALP